MNQEELFGIVNHFVYHNQETGFGVMIIHTKQKEKVTVTGSFVNIHAGQDIYLQGTWTFHPKFGKQFQATSYYSKLPNNIIGLKKYLASGLIKGIGKVYAEKIVDHFTQDTLTIIDEHPHRLHEVPGIGKKRVETIIASWKDQKYIAEIMVFLQDKGITTTYATKIYKKYGQNSIAFLTENPYRLTTDIWGIGFKTADMIAQNLGFELDSIKRVKAGILFNLQESAKNGHVYQELETLKNNTFSILDLSPELHQTHMKHALHELYNEEAIKLISYNTQHFLGTASFYFTEKSLATKITNLITAKTKYTFDLKHLHDILQSTQHIHLNEDQHKGILRCFEDKVSVVTGGPGTGKTTLIKALLTLLEKQHIRYKLAAPTGRAAKRMIEGTGRPATTIHRLLEIDPATMQFTYNEQNALPIDFLIIDEASMIDIFLAHAIIKAIPLQAHIIFIGDIDQLPSVGPGNFLRDLIASKKVGVTKLQHIFRQAQDSMIIRNAHRINQGEFPTTQLPECKKDFYFNKEDQPENIINHIKKILFQKLPLHGIDIQKSVILTPMNKGAVGTQKLNHDLQQLLNPHKQLELSYAGTTFKMHDRVMQIKNNYDKKVFNGDIGTITNIHVDDRTMTIQFDTTHATYAFEELDEITLAYAITIHKSQGSEYDAVIIPLFLQHFTLLQRNLIYTAITRAKKVCFFIGQTKAIAIAIKNNKTIDRITFLEKFLTEELSCR